MKRILTAAAIALLATTAHASQLLSAEGRWKTTFHVTQDVPMCVASTEWRSASGDLIGMVLLKGMKDGSMFFHLVRTSWRLPLGVEVPLTVSFDNGVHARQAIGRTTKTTASRENYGNMVEITVRSDAIASVLDDFAESQTMVVTFVQGNEPPWRADMTGSRTAARTLAECVVRIGGNVAAAPPVTSPVGPSATSPVGPKATSPVAPKATSPVAPTSQPVIAKPKDNGSI